MTNVHHIHNPWRTKEGMSKHLGVSKRTVYEMHRRGELERRTLPGGKVEWRRKQSEVTEEAPEEASKPLFHAPSEDHSEDGGRSNRKQSEASELSFLLAQERQRNEHLNQKLLETTTALVRAQHQTEILQAQLNRLHRRSLYGRFKLFLAKIFRK